MVADALAGACLIAAGGVERRHGGRIAVDAHNRRWCSDGFQIGCDNLPSSSAAAGIRPCPNHWK
jgi:hypothetical protein